MINRKRSAFKKSPSIKPLKFETQNQNFIKPIGEIENDSPKPRSIKNLSVRFSNEFVKAPVSPKAEPMNLDLLEDDKKLKNVFSEEAFKTIATIETEKE